MVSCEFRLSEVGITEIRESLGEEALRYLKEFRPKESASLQESGTLNEHVQGIMDHAEQELNDLLHTGLPTIKRSK